MKKSEVVIVKQEALSLDIKPARAGKTDGQIQFDFLQPAPPPKPDVVRPVERPPERADAAERAALKALEAACRADTLENLFEGVADQLAQHVPFDRMAYAAVKESGASWRWRWTRGASQKENWGQAQTLSSPDPLIRAFDAGPRPRIINQLGSFAEKNPGLSQDFVSEGFGAMLLIPLLRGEKPVGGLFFWARESGAYKNNHADLCGHLAGPLAAAVEKTRALQRARENLASKDKYMRMVVHDLRHPLSVIQGFSSLLADNKVGRISTDQVNVLTRVLGMCRQMNGMLEELLAMDESAGVFHMEPQTVSPVSFFEECHASLASLPASKEMEWLLRADRLPAKAVFDPDRIAQVIQNLVSNAVKFSQPRSTVTLTAKMVLTELQVSVQDQGQGISEEDMQRLFMWEGKTETKPAGGETSHGLGLAIAKHIVNAHGGRIWAKSQLDRGSTFTFALPIAG